MGVKCNVCCTSLYVLEDMMFPNDQCLIFSCGELITRAYRALKNKIFLYCIIGLLLLANGAMMLHLWRRKWYIKSVQCDHKKGMYGCNSYRRCVTVCKNQNGYPVYSDDFRGIQHTFSLRESIFFIPPSFELKISRTFYLLQYQKRSTTISHNAAFVLPSQYWGIVRAWTMFHFSPQI